LNVVAGPESVVMLEVNHHHDARRHTWDEVGRARIEAVASCAKRAPRRE